LSEPNADKPADLLIQSAKKAEIAFASHQERARSRLEKQLGGKAEQVLQAIPILFHSNKEGLPGYARALNLPAGISGYRPSKSEVALAKELFPKAKVKTSGGFNGSIEFIAVINDAEDGASINVWLALSDAQLSESSLDQLEKKTAAVESWIKKYGGCCVVFHLMPCKEISSSMELRNRLLLDGIWLAGRIPFWRLIPPFVSEKQYDEHVKILMSNPMFGIQAYIDLGPAFQPKLREDVGDSIKALIEKRDIDYAWALQMAMLEMRLSQGEDAPSVYEGAKGQILAGILVDSSLMEVDAVARFYLSKKMAKDAEVITSWRYLICGFRLRPGSFAHGGTDSGTEAFVRYACGWSWDDKLLERLNAWKDSGIAGTIDFEDEVNSFLANLWRRVRGMLERPEMEGWAEKETLGLMDCKIEAQCSDSPWKIKKSCNRAAAPAKALTLLHGELDSGLSWALIQGSAPMKPQEGEINPIREDSDPAALLLWAAANNVLGQNTRLFIKGIEENVAFSDLDRLSKVLLEFIALPVQDTEKEKSGDEGHTSYPVKILALPNFGRYEHELLSLAAVYETNLGEIYYRTWSGADVLKEFCSSVLIPFLLTEFREEALEVFVQRQKVRTMGNAAAAFQRELPELSVFLGGSTISPHERRRYVGNADENYFVIERAGQAVDFVPLESYDALIRSLTALSPHSRVETLVGNYDGPLNILREAAKNSSYGYMDIFAITEGERGELIFFDEIGHMSCFTHHSEEQIYQLSHLLVFLENIFAEVRGQPNTPLVGESFRECLKIHTIAHGQRRRAFLSTNNYLTKVDALGLEPFDLGLEKDGEDGYKVRWGKESISSAETPNPLGELQRRIKIIRQSGRDYDIFLTKVFLDDGFISRFKDEFVSTGHYLFYKNILEAKLFS